MSSDDKLRYGIRSQPGTYLRGAILALLIGLTFCQPETDRALGSKSMDETPESKEKNLLSMAGDSSFNIPIKTMGGKQVWADEKIYSGWRIQRHALTGHFRLLDPKNVRRAWGSLEKCDERLRELKAEGEIPKPSGNVVILLHGIWRAKESMRALQTALRDEGYEAVSLNYPSTQGRIEEHAAQLARIIDNLEGAEKISFVTHSMGGLVVRRYLQDNEDDRIGRLVMMAPPNRGAGLGRVLDKAGLFKPIFGPAGPQMLEDAEDGILDLAIPTCSFGVIAGGKGDGEGYNPLLPGDDDMVVEVENTKLEGMADFLLIPKTHTFIMEAPETIAAVKSFLVNGKFQKESNHE